MIRSEVVGGGEEEKRRSQASPFLWCLGTMLSALLKLRITLDNLGYNGLDLRPLWNGHVGADRVVWLSLVEFLSIVFGSIVSKPHKPLNMMSPIMYQGPF